MITTPKYWLDFLSKFDLEGKEYAIPEQDDLSEMGASLKILDQNGIHLEMNEAYPGIIVKEQGYIPIASCCYGSGDPYFINENDGPNGPLYRILHDVVFDQNYDKEEAIETVISNYGQLESFSE